MATATLIEQAIDFLKKIPNDAGAEQDAGQAGAEKEHVFIRDNVVEVAGLKLPKGNSADQVDHIVKLLRSYVNDSSEKKALSIVIFGPPGSGKSTFVNNIANEIEGIELVKTANLTQISDSEEMTEAFKDALLTKRGSADIPVIFFDEFDTMRSGTPLGWLSWFLAPMEDGEVLAKGQEVQIGKAVFIFAGGTAETLNEFNQRAKLDPETYRARKVPDFVSRLRGAIDIGGVNGHGDERIVRRTLALSYLLDSKSAATLDEQIIRQLLENGHFVHGVRSLKTYLKAKSGTDGKLKLPETIRNQHFSRGVFDGLTVGLSAGLEKDGSQCMSVALTEQLLRSGAAIAYAGAFFPEGTLASILKKAKDSPSDLVNEPKKRARVINYLGHPALLNAEEDVPNVFKSILVHSISREELLELQAPLDEFFPAIPKHFNTYNPKHHAAWAISQFRLRIRVIQDVGALVVFGGKDDGRSWGRMSGIAEEVMIALALDKPIYVLGGAGGAATEVGKLLGLSNATAATKRFLSSAFNVELDAVLKEYETEFDVPGLNQSPKSLEEIRSFLFHRGVNTQAWPWNGLSVNENRELFACDISKNPNRAVELVLRGLGRIEWKYGRR